MLRDYQRVLIDNIISDMGDAIFSEFPNASIDSIGESFRIKLESRIEAYDQERKEQIVRDMPKAIERALSDVL